MPDSRINLYDRVKETSYTEGTNDITLAGAVGGFSSFSSVFTSGDRLFYAITDGTDYEVGSGIFHTGVSRFPLRSSNSNNKVSFGAGLKEIYVTYPATHSVLIGSGLDDLSVAEQSGIAFWGSAHTLDYDSNIIWDKGNDRLGVNTSSPQYAIDVGGSKFTSSIRSSGIIVGDSGVLFPSGSQTEPFKKNTLADSNIQAVLELSGVVNQHFWLKKQNEGTFFAGPPSGCVGDCVDYPSFRGIVRDDYPFLMDASGALHNHIMAVSGVTDHDLIYTVPKELAQHPDHAEGLVFYDAHKKALVVFNDESGVTPRIGQDLYLRVRNETGSTIHKTSGVKIISGYDDFFNNQIPLVDLAISSGEPFSNVVGLAAHEIENNEFGYVLTQGTLTGIDLSSFSRGDRLFLSSTNSGVLVNSSPSTPNYVVPLGYVVYNHNTSGSMYVDIKDSHFAGGEMKTDTTSSNVMSGIPFITNIANPQDASYTTDSGIVYDNTNNRLAINVTDASGINTATHNVSVSGDLCATEIYQSGHLVVDRFSVTHTGSSAWNFTGVGFNGDADPDIVLNRGMTYEFDILNAGTHRFWINKHPSSGNPSQYALGESSGVFNNGAANGIIRFTVPQNSPKELWFNCGNHEAMSGRLLISHYNPVSGDYVSSTITNRFEHDLVSGTVPINWANNKQIQTGMLDGWASTLTKGTGWSSSPVESQDVFLLLSGVVPTTITWSIVNGHWYNKPDASISGQHSFVLRSFGNTINGYHLGTGSGV